MSVKRWWLANAPSNGIDALDRSQYLVGYPKILAGALPTFDLTSYLRRYLNDTLTVSVDGVAAPVDPGVDSILNAYIRRYLNDTK